MREASLKQRIPCNTQLNFQTFFSGGKKCALYTSKYGIFIPVSIIVC